MISMKTTENNDDRGRQFPIVICLLKYNKSSQLMIELSLKVKCKKLFEKCIWLLNNARSTVCLVASKNRANGLPINIHRTKLDHPISKQLDPATGEWVRSRSATY